MTRRSLAFPLLVGVFVLLGLVHSVIVPLGEAPDEVSHYAYVNYMLEERALPKPEGAVLGEAKQPPLYYLIGALATAWIPDQELAVIANPEFTFNNPDTPNLLLHPRTEGYPYKGSVLAWHLVRVLSLLMAAVTVWATWKTALELFAGDEWKALAAAATVAFLPGFLFISAVANNDNLVVMLSALAVLQICRLIARPARLRDAVWLGILLGLAPLAKLSGLLLWPFSAIVLLAQLAAPTRRQALRSLAPAFGVAMVIISPWVLYNLNVHGEPLGWSLVGASSDVRQTAMTLADWVAFAQATYTSFVGRFGGAMHLTMPGWAYALLGLAGLVSAAGWIGHLRDGLSNRSQANSQRVLLLFALFWLLMLAALVRWTLEVLGTDQARLLYPGLSLLAVFLVSGLARLFRPMQRLAIAVWVGGFFVLGLIMALYPLLVYPAPTYRSDSLAALGGVEAPADFETIRVLDYRVDRDRAVPGDKIAVDVYWQALSDPTEHYWLLLQLAGKDGAAANKDGAPAAGRATTDWWKKDQVYVSRHTLELPGDLPPGTYALQLGLHPFGRWEWLPVRGQDMLVLGRVNVGTGP